jgi:uncharacterized membrane protein
MKGRALLLVLLILLSTLAVADSSAEPEETRSSGRVLVRMYIHLSPTDSSLSTEAGRNGVLTTTSLDFPSPELEEDLRVQTVETGVGDNRGFEAYFSVGAGFQGASVTVAILEDDDVIAERERDIPSTAIRTDWRIPLVDDADHFTFSRNSAITLRITSNRNVIVSTDESSFLELYCLDHLDISTETRDVEGRRASSFYPNDLMEFRHILVEGDITNPFGNADVEGVNVSIRRPDGRWELEDAAATVGNDLNYTYDWDYPTDLPAGSYTINVTGRDLQGNEFYTVGSFIMADYGVRIFGEGEEGGVISDTTTPGTPAKYTLTILNIGGKRAEIALDEGDPIPLWQTSFSRRTFSLDAGADEDVTFDVKPSATLGGGNESSFSVTVTVNNDPGTPKSSDNLEVRTFVSNEVKLQVQPEDPDPVTIAVDGTRDYTFTVRNLGEFATNVDLSRTGVPSGWAAEFTGTRVGDSAIEDLRPMEIVDVVLRVDAPTTSEVDKANIKVKVQSREYPDQKEERTFVFNLVIGLVLTPTSPTDTTQDPGDTVRIFFDANNNDPNDAHQATFSVEQETSNWPASSFKFTPSTQVNIQPDSTSDMGVEVEVPSTAKAGVFEFHVRGVVDGNDEVFDTFDFKVTISLNRNLVVSLDPDAKSRDIGTKEESLVFLQLDNQGNQVERVNITVVTDSDDVEVRMNDALTSIVLNLAVQPGTTEEVKLGFKAKESASLNQAIRVTITVDPVEEQVPVENDFDLVVKLTTAEMLIKYMQWAIIIIAMVIVMGALLLWNPRKKRIVEEPADSKDKDAAHGTVVRH